jgi:hypothetical protein
LAVAEFEQWPHSLFFPSAADPLPSTDKQLTAQLM